MRVNPNRFARLLVGVGLTLLAFWLARPAAVLQAASDARWPWIFAAIALVIFDRALMAYRWIVLLRAVDPAHRPPLAPVVRIFFVSTFVGTFLPSVGGDLVRAYSLSRLGVRGAESGASVLMDRFLGAVSILLVASASLAMATGRERQATLAPLGLAAAVCTAGLIVIFSRRAAALLERALQWFRSERFRRIVMDLLGATRRYGGHRGVLVNVLIGSVAVQMLRIVQAYCLGRSLNITSPFSTYLVLIPLLLLIMLVPITVNGLGTSQVGCVWLFGTVGVPEAQAFALSVLFVALGAVGNLPGGLIYALGSRDARVRDPVARS